MGNSKFINFFVVIPENFINHHMLCWLSWNQMVFIVLFTHGTPKSSLQILYYYSQMHGQLVEEGERIGMPDRK